MMSMRQQYPTAPSSMHPGARAGRMAGGLVRVDGGTVPMNRHISRIAIVNRGEAAMRLVNAVRELREEGAHDLVAIALHTAAERRAMFVREADEAVAFDAVAGNPYLDFGA